jgi:hypothetical protein
VSGKDETMTGKTEFRTDVIHNVVPENLSQEDADRQQAARDDFAHRLSRAWESPDRVAPIAPATADEAYEQQKARLGNAWKEGR